MSSNSPGRPPHDRVEANLPFRWDLVDQRGLGSLLDDRDQRDLWYLDDLIECAAKVLARCADGDLYFVGRSADSVYDLLGGVLEDTSWRDRLHLLPFSFHRGPSRLRAEQVDQLRANLAAIGLSPHRLARRRRPVTFVDLVFGGHTFGNLYGLLRDWIDDDRAQWDVIRGKLRFLGITERTKTSPKTWRWQQHAAWTAELPPRAITNVSIDGGVWGYFGDIQQKLTPSFRPDRWSEEWVRSPRHDPKTRQALREAATLVVLGGRHPVRERLTRWLVAEPTMAQRWLRSLVIELRAATDR